MERETDTDTLLDRVASGDLQAREQLFGQYRERLKRMINMRMDRRLAPRLDCSDVVQEALAEAGVAAQVEKVTDTLEIAGYGVFGTPAVVVGGEIKSVGRIPSKQDVIGWIRK